MSAASGIARSVPGNRPPSWSSPMSLSSRCPRFLSSPQRHSCRARAWCVLRVIPLRSPIQPSNRRQWRRGASLSGNMNHNLFDRFQEFDGIEGKSRGRLSGEADDGVRAGRSDRGTLEDALEIAETLCIAPSVVLVVGSVANLVFPGAIKPLQSGLGNAILVWQFVLLLGAVAIGRTIRRRQWQRFCRENGASVNLLDRIEKIEEDLRSSATIIRVLSRQLEKLGIRFRVTRRTLKDPISETAALAQKNSEATRALAMQEDVLERELGEIQKVLLAMQEQQRKQLELILAIGKAGKMIDGSKEPEEDKRGRSSSPAMDSKTSR